MVVHIIPGAAGRKIDRPAHGSRFQDVRHQQVAPEQEREAFVVGAFVLLELIHRSPHDGRARLARFPHGGIEIRGQPVTQKHRFADKVFDAAVHPGFGHRVVRIRGMDGKARLEDPVLHPAQEEFRIRGRASEAADIRAFVRLAGKAHAGQDGDAVLQAFPAGAVVAAPGLGIALDAGRPAAADDIGPCVRIKFGNRFGRRFAHEVAHHRAQRFNGGTRAVGVRKRIAVLHAVVLAVVVPDGGSPHGKDTLLQAPLPGVPGLRVRKVPESSFSAPPAAYRRLLRISAVLQENSLPPESFKLRVA